MDNKTKETLAFLFARNKEANSFSMTSDGQFFSEKHRAESHSQNLKDAKVTTYHRSAFETVDKLKAQLSAKEAEVEAVKAEQTAKEAAEQAANKATKTEELETVTSGENQEEKPVEETKVKTTKKAK
ncbi:hypothetical protein QT327_21265 [Olivibacter sp. 47]|uniref:hypothetical protein n=1 Tax=Olivibacter sp. 47 TaxID=3056486 RepID=UPI0025A32462|nr:hypothetical protein [Olivibacter sp. 47]MDM8176846.1 hypothetical protein [Olivibacter sp. 47]